MSTFNKYRTKGAYHWDWYETEDWYKWMIDRCVDFCRGFTVDLGGGDGLLAHKIIENGFSAVVFDRDKDALMICQQRGIPNQEANINNLHGYSPTNFDYLACVNSIEHFTRPEVVREFIRQYVKKGAIIVTIDYQGDTLGEDHKFEWTYDQLLDFFKEFNPKGFRYKDTEWIGVEIRK